MRYVIVGNTAILATRNIERITEGFVLVSVVGVPDGATLGIQCENTLLTYIVESEAVSIPCSDMADGVYTVTVQTNEHTVYGNPFKLQRVGGEVTVLPAPLAAGTELEQMWNGIVNMLEVFVPLIDTLQNGSEVI